MSLDHYYRFVLWNSTYLHSINHMPNNTSYHLHIITICRVVFKRERSESELHLQVWCNSKTGRQHKVIINTYHHLHIIGIDYHHHFHSIMLQMFAKCYPGFWLIKSFPYRYRDLSRDYSNSRYEVGIKVPDPDCADRPDDGRKTKTSWNIGALSRLWQSSPGLFLPDSS